MIKNIFYAKFVDINVYFLPTYMIKFYKKIIINSKGFKKYSGRKKKNYEWKKKIRHTKSNMKCTLTLEVLSMLCLDKLAVHRKIRRASLV